MSASPPITHLYRSILRELRLASKQPRATRNSTVQRQLRTLVLACKTSETQRRALLETRDFLRSSRIHDELLKRYNPTHGLTEEERVRATARRVGLDAPIEFKKDE